MKSYMITWLSSLEGGGIVNRQTLINAIDSIDIVHNWRASTGAIFVSSPHTAEEISRRIRRSLPKLAFVVAQIDLGNIHGWTDKDSWNFIQHPKAVWDK